MTNGVSDELRATAEANSCLGGVLPVGDTEAGGATEWSKVFIAPREAVAGLKMGQVHGGAPKSWPTGGFAMHPLDIFDYVPRLGVMASCATNNRMGRMKVFQACVL